MPAIARLWRLFGAAPPGVLVLLACWGVAQLPSLPPRPALIAFALAAGLILATAMGLPAPPGAGPARWRPMFALGVSAAAAVWAMWRADAALSQRLAAELEGRQMTLIGVVEDMPQSFDRGVRFRFRIEQCVQPAEPCPGPVAVRLNWYKGFSRERQQAIPALSPGQRWELAVRLKRPHAALNPGLFDSELRALEEGIAASGYVRSGPAEPASAFVPSLRTVVERARASIRGRMLQLLANRPESARGVVVALVVGDQAAIAASWWELFNRTGVGHLMSISGLHITMLAALGAALTDRLWRSRRLAARMRVPLPALLPTPYARWLVGLSWAFAYAALAGWGIPAQRTCWMLAAAGLAMLSGRARSPVAVLGTAAGVVCALDPWAPLAAGFWLSFAAVSAIIWYGSAGTARHGRSPGRGWREQARRTLTEALRSQWAATLVLLPLGVVFFSSVSLVSPLANAFAIPLVSAVITPLALSGAALSMLWPALGGPPLWLAAWLTEGLLAALRWVEFGGSGAIALPAPSAAALALSSLACAFLLMPLRLPGRAVAALGMLPLLLAGAPRPLADELRVTAFDVGQGTAVLLETRDGRLLYDTGPQLGTDSDAGSRVIVPWLRSRGIDRLEALVVSHLDLDHSGGGLAVLRGLRVDWVASSLPPDHPIRAAAPRHYDCRRGERWRWGDTEFTWLHPGPDRETPVRSPTNARSCVLRVRSPGGTILLAGDIEAAQEKRLLELYPAAELKADLLLAPHHGSTTSSSPAFLQAVAPRWAIFQVGYRNRYRHPNPKVLERYHDLGIAELRTDRHGAIGLRLQPGRPASIERARVDDARYWRIRVAQGAAAPVDGPDP
jgi:competence protein ComEC